ncbi:glycoside hydrolase family 3 N-terminal domain-containing protein [Agromyces archimandritae]|uniref:Glycoside hydrolase family 3 protein n=1 Tax=Agromyces archimandritae TaxID=2781962 RepID=A0A975FLK5_9MICO|nr:glycoside hydrolase family 3 N-terminal domain-containing protein [Agromyces archimandritae]QTX04725.1 glycoside hydrolase family 3 protein [Agromyces archimandritae]
MRRSSASVLIAAATLMLLAACAPSGGAPAAAPTPTETPTPTLDPIAAEVEERLSDMSIEQRAAQLFMLHAPGTDPAPLAALADLGIGGLILMGDNVPATPAELAALVDAVDGDPDFPLLIGIDEEGGDVQRLPWDDAAAAPTLRDAPPEATEEAFARRASLLAEAGVSVNFGIIADVTADPDSFIFDRVLGTDPRAAAERAAAAVEGEHGVVASTLKHFPGHGAAPGDSHTSIPAADLSLEEWRAGPALPFAAGIDAGAELVMTGHLAYPAVDEEPATLSRAWHEMLRDELGFDGVVVTDDMTMLQNSGLPEYQDPVENAVRAVVAGGDLLLYVLPADPADVGIDPAALISGLVTAVEEGRIPPERLEDAARHVLTLRLALADR